MASQATNIRAIYSTLKREFSKRHMPVIDLITVQTKDPFKILVSTILSARTKDETTAAASKRLYSRVRTAAELRRLSLEEITTLIFPVGFYREKSRYLKKLPDALDSMFGGRIPDTVDELVQLPGVGRKTANLVVALAFRKPAICVDVHVHRICNRLGYVRTATPFETEMRLREILPAPYWTTFNSFLVSFGQHTCRPVNPHCDTCPISRWCMRTAVRTTHEVRSL